tara:strand:+ start:61 stop:291 length:231 start_codon:yes stop_codon:yes gene_type:complete
MPISNEIFESYRIEERVKEQLSAIKLLVAQGYTILDLEGNILNKHTINLKQDTYHKARPRYDYKRVIEKKLEDETV